MRWARPSLCSIVTCIGFPWADASFHQNTWVADWQLLLGHCWQNLRLGWRCWGNTWAGLSPDYGNLNLRARRQPGDGRSTCFQMVSLILQSATLHSYSSKAWTLSGFIYYEYKKLLFFWKGNSFKLLNKLWRNDFKELLDGLEDSDIEWSCWMEGLLGCIHGWTDSWIDGWVDVHMDGWTNGRMDKQMDGWREGWVDRWVGGRMCRWL